MSLTEKTIAYVALASVLLLGGSARAATPQEKCLQQLYTAAAKYAACQQRVVGNFFGSGFVFKPLTNNCAVRYATTWSKLQAIGAEPCSGSRFVDNGDGTVTDNLTWLVWEKKTGTPGSRVDCATTSCTDPHDVNGAYQWSAGTTTADGRVFIDFLAKLNGGECFAGQCDWRLPTLNELQTILSAPYPCASAPCIDPIFGPTQAAQSAYYWSAISITPYAMWSVYFSDGALVANSKTFTSYVRAVRGGL